MIVAKVGGSQSRGAGLPALAQELGRLGARHPLLVVPGGGAFADVTRDHYRRYALSEATAHRMALLAMDQYGCLLGDLVPGSVLVTDILSAHQAARRGQTPILLPSSLLIQADPLPHSWQVTSDTIAAWVAGLLRSPRLILLKDVDGLYAQIDATQWIQQMTVEELASHRGGVDEYLATVLASVDLETWVINGQHPERLAELLQTGQTLGTLIVRGTKHHLREMEQ